MLLELMCMEEGILLQTILYPFSVTSKLSLSAEGAGLLAATNCNALLVSAIVCMCVCLFGPLLHLTRSAAAPPPTVKTERSSYGNNGRRTKLSPPCTDLPAVLFAQLSAAFNPPLTS